MKIVDKVHGEFIYNRRVETLSRHLSEVIPPNASVLDVGCGDGQVAHAITERRQDVTARGVDVLLREKSYFPIDKFDGENLPYPDKSFDAVMFVDVLHHTNDPMILLREAARVSRGAIIIKDHTREGFLAGTTLRLMDYVGNARYNVALPYNYWMEEQWKKAFDELELKCEVWKEELQLYPVFLDWIFGRSLHFVARLVVNN